MNAEDRIQAYRSTLDRLNGWIEGHRQPDGSWISSSTAAGYFSLPPYAFEVGRLDWAFATIRHVEGSFMGADNTLQQGDKRVQMLPYVPAWLAWGKAVATMPAAENAALPSPVGSKLSSMELMSMPYPPENCVCDLRNPG